MTDAREFEQMIHHIGQTPPKPSLARRIRKFWDELFHFRAVRMCELLEAEVKILRRNDNLLVQVLKEENAALRTKVEKLELAIWPLATRAGQVYAASMTPPAPALKIQPQSTTWEQLVQQRIEENERLDREEAEKKAAKEN